MDKRYVQDIAAVVTTLAESGGGAPETMIYMALECDLRRWDALRMAMIGAELISESGNYVTITRKGRILAAKIETALAQGATA